jgi:hypothetical protein
MVVGAAAASEPPHLMRPPSTDASVRNDADRADRLRLLRQRLQGATTDGERLHALFDLLEYPAATWQDALNALSYEAPTANQASYYFHILLQIPGEGGRSIIDPAYWLRLLQSRGLNASDPLRRTAQITPSND